MKNLKLILLFTFICGSLSANIYAQTTLFSIPNTDIIAKKDRYVEFDFVSHLESKNKGGFQTYIPRFIYGVGEKVEIGLNVAFTKSSTPNSIEIQPNIKYRYYSDDKKGVAASVGTILYAPVTRRTGTNTFAMVYANVSKQVKGKYGPRFTGGAYGLVNRKKNTGSRAGVLVGFEQPINSKLKFVTDWFSGNNRFGYVTPGFSITTSKTSSVFIGYNIGNEGRKNNSLFVSFGTTF